MNSMYIVPICDIKKKKVYNLKLHGRSENDCEQKLIDKFADITDSDDYDEFIDELNAQGILVGEIQDIETL